MAITILSAAGYGAILTNQDCDLSAAQDIYLKWDEFASETGLYTVSSDTTECVGVSPKLHLNMGQTYAFHQTDISNWYHPVGFSYEPGGAHNDCGDGSGECPELGGEDSGTLTTSTREQRRFSISLPYHNTHSRTHHHHHPRRAGTTLQYYVNDVAVADDESGFGLDAYEPLFFYPQDDWSAYTFKVHLTVPDVTSFYYFCHIHSTMSALIEVVGASVDAASPTRHDDFFVEPPEVSAQDEACGTVGVADFMESSYGDSTCDGKAFLCGDSLSSSFNECLQAIDCKMHHDMAVHTDDDPVKTFMRQMIPHHANAVSMAKVLLKHANVADEVAALARAIINVQNAQIQEMQGYLDGEGADHGTKCYEDSGNGCPYGCVPASSRRRLLFASSPCGDGCVVG